MVKASRLALIAAALLLAATLIAVIIGFSAAPREEKPDFHVNEAAIAIAASSGSVVVFDSPTENEHTDSDCDDFVIEVMPEESYIAPIETREAKRVLIYHTHTHEAYTKRPGDDYVEDSAWRTADERYSIVRVGEELAELLEGFGVDVTHDTTDHEPPKLATAYQRSFETLKKYDQQDFDLYIDLHRDAYDDSMARFSSVSVGGVDAARLMVLIGNGDGFDIKPATGTNLSFARKLTENLNDIADGICRDVLVKVGRYNQHVGTPAILIEVGHNRNTLSEALASMPILARALSEILGS